MPVNSRPAVSIPALAALAALALLPVARASAQTRLWEANLVDPAEALPLGFAEAPDTSLIRYPAGDVHAALISESAWDGVFDRETASRVRPRYEALAARSAQTLWAAPLPQTLLALTWSGSLERNRYLDPDRIAARLGRGRGALGMAWVQHILPPQPGSYLDAGVRIPDGLGLGYAWMLSGGRGPWGMEYGVTRRDADEDVSVVNLDSTGNGETVRGVYATRVLTQRLLLKAPLAGGALSLIGAYAFARPRRPEDQEFWFCDSSRAADGALVYRRPWRGWSVEGRSALREREAFTIGRRIPPGSDGLKRFHFARNHAEGWELGGDALRPGASAGAGLRGDWGFGASYRSLDWESHPPPDAFDSRRETLSFNRLGLSFIANLYGGLYKVSELADAEAAAQVWEARGLWTGRLGPLALDAGVSLFRADFRFAAQSRTLSQRFLSLDTAVAAPTKLTGYLAGATPRLRAALAWRRLQAHAEAAQIVPVISRLRKGGAVAPGPASAPGAPASAAHYPLFRNGFEARAGLSLEF